MRENSPLHRQLLIYIRNRLVKSQRLDVTAEFTQRVETFCRAGARVGNKVIEAVLTRDHDKVSHTARQSHSYDDGIATAEVRIDQLLRGQVLVHVPHAIGRKPRRTVPINPAVLGVSVNQR